MKRILLTGGCGFIGSNFARLVVERFPDWEVTILDKLTYAGRLENILDIRERVRFIKGDICRDEDVEKGFEAGADYVVNFAAESHVDRSIADCGPFVQTEVLGVSKLLTASKNHGVERLIQISTDEVHGSIEKGAFKEGDPLRPGNPYAACKAGQEHLVLSFHNTFGLPVLITRTTNNYGPFQHIEKFIPKMAVNALMGRPLPLFGDGRHIRNWIHVTDNCEAILLVLLKGEAGGIYNISSTCELENIEVAKRILKYLKRPLSLITFIDDRPGHDRRYALDSSNIRGLGWQERVGFDEGLSETLKWYRENRCWWIDLFESS